MPGTRTVCVMVCDDPFEQIVPELMAEMNAASGDLIPLPQVQLLDMMGPGYAIPSREGNEAIRMMLQQEGIVLDPCYTGKAFAGLVKLAREGRFRPEDNVLFIHTGGAGGLFAPDWEQL